MFLLSCWSLSPQATTWVTPNSSSAYSSKETKACLLPPASWLLVMFTYSRCCQSTASQLERTPPSPAAEKQILTAKSCVLSKTVTPAMPVLDPSSSLTRSEGTCAGYQEYPSD